MYGKPPWQAAGADQTGWSVVCRHRHHCKCIIEPDTAILLNPTHTPQFRLDCRAVELSTVLREISQTRAFSLLKAPSEAFKNLLRYYAKWVFKYGKVDTCLQWSLEPLSMGTVKSCEVLLTALVNCSLLHWLPWPHHCWSWTRNKWSMCWSCPQKTFYTVLVIHAHYLFINSLQFMGKF